MLDCVIEMDAQVSEGRWVDRWMEEAGRERKKGGQVDLYSLAQDRDCLFSALGSLARRT